MESFCLSTLCVSVRALGKGSLAHNEMHTNMHKSVRFVLKAAKTNRKTKMEKKGKTRELACHVRKQLSHYSQ